MLFPLGTDRPLKRPTLVTYWLVGINVAVYLAGAIYGSHRVNPDGYQRLIELLALDPQHLTLWAPLTYQFLHAGAMHLFGNMAFLYVFGPNVEDRLGRWWFLVFYLLGGIIAGLSHYLFEPPIPDSGGFVPSVVGASGAIAAVTGAYIVLFPKTMVRLFLFLGVIGVFQVPAMWFIGAAIVKDVLFQAAGRGDGVALLAHIGGYAFGIGTCLVLLWTHRIAREPYDLFSIGKQAHRRRVFRELTTSGRTAWMHEVGSAAKVVKSGPAGPDEGQVQERRAAISRSLAEGQTEEAARLYESLLKDAGEIVLARAAQIDLANHFYRCGRHQAAAESFEIFLRRYPGDREAVAIRLMLATINARYLNDPVRAKSLLGELRGRELSATHRELADELARELG